MIREEQKKYLLETNEKLLTFLNQFVGMGKGKIMSERKLAEMLGCSNSTVNRWLKRESSLRIDMAIKICDIFNLDKKEMLNDIFIDKNDDNIDIKLRFMNLSNDNKMRVIEYIDYLLYQQEKLNELENNKILKK